MLNFIKNPASGGIPLIEKPIKVNNKANNTFEFLSSAKSVR